MIRGVTHLTMEAALRQGIEAGRGFGFGLDFSDDVALPAGFEGVEDSGHVLPLAVLTSSRGIRLEVVQHRWQTGRRGAYTGVLRCQPPPGPVVGRPEVASILRRAALLLDPVCVALAVPGGEAWFESAPAAGGLAGILCHASDVRAEARFWERFARIRWKSVGAAAAWGSLPSALPQAQCDFVIAGCGETPSAYSMNDTGFPSIGVFSTAIEADCERAVAAGAALRSGPAVTTVGGRPLKLALISAPSGAPVELLAAHPGAAARPGAAHGRPGRQARAVQATPGDAHGSVTGRSPAAGCFCSRLSRSW